MRAVPHSFTPPAHLNTTGVKKVADIVRQDQERERAFLREKAELEAELGALQEQIESMKELMTEEDQAELAASG